MNERVDNVTPQDKGEKRPLSTSDMAGAGERQHPVTGADSVMRSSGASGRMDVTPLFNPEQTQTFRGRWSDIQTGFVDEPRHAVEQADSLVAELMQDLARSFAAEKNKLEQQWGHGQDVSTEDLRLALQRYRSFFDRLLSL